MNFDKLIQFRKQSRYRTVHHFKKFLMHSCNQRFLSSLTSANTNLFSIQFCPYKKVIWRESYSRAMFRVHLLSINTIHLKLILVIVYTSSTVLIGWLTDHAVALHWMILYKFYFYTFTSWQTFGFYPVSGNYE